MSPASVADAEFSTARRGFDQDEVRAMLRQVAAELGRLSERERFLQHELRVAQERAVDPDAALDEETVARLVGEETLRVLQTARESAAQIKGRAEESAARILREASDDADRLRAEADTEAARIRSDASADAEAELALAKQQGREMVNEARAYRERVLAELGRRREAARQQIEQLAAGRDRLLQVFERARLVAVDVMSDLAPLAEPDEYVNLAPTTGPVPLMVPRERSDESVAEESVAEESVAAEEPVAEDEPVAAEDESVAEEAEESVVEDEPVVEDESEPVVEEEPEPSADGGPDDPDGDNVVSLFARLRAEAAATEPESSGEPHATSPDATSPGEPPTGEPPTGESQVADPPAADPPAAGDDAEPADVAETIFERRDAELVPLITSAARKLKRVLADEQNDVLDRLRQRDSVSVIDDVVPERDAHAERYANAVTGELLDAAAAGARLLDPDAPAPAPEVLVPVHDLIASALVEPLRNRLERAVADGDGANDEIAKLVRAVYREWKTTHIDDQLDDVLRLAHGAGAMGAVTPGTPMCWAVDPNGPACPDAEDNALAGVVPAGEPYPTGHRVAPAHPGCRCLIAPTGN